MKNLKEIMVEYNTTIGFKLFDKTIAISAERNIYTQLRKKYAAIADEMYRQYLTIDEGYKKLDDLVANAEAAFYQLIQPGIQEVVNDALSVGLMTLDTKTVLSECTQRRYFSAFQNAFEAFSDPYKRITGDLEYNKAARSESSVHGMVLDMRYGGSEGAENAIMNAFDNAADKSQAKREMKALFDNQNLRNNLRNAFWSCCLNLHCYIVDCFPKKLRIKIGGYVSTDASKKAEAAFNNLQTVNLPDAQKQDFVKSILTLNPYVGNYYIGFANLFPDNIPQFLRISDYFGISDLKKFIQGVLVDFVNNTIGVSEDDAYHSRTLLDEKVASYEMRKEDASPAYQIIEERLIKLDLEYRTVEGIVFETREEADSARSDISSHQDILNNPGEFIFRSDYIAHIEKIKELPINAQLINTYTDRYTAKLATFDRKCEKAARFQYIMEHHSPFWNGDQKDMVIHYGIFGLLLFIGIILLIKQKAPFYFILSIVMLIYTLIVKPFLEIVDTILTT